jgi:hypothetical protein
MYRMGREQGDWMPIARLMGLTGFVVGTGGMFLDTDMTGIMVFSATPQHLIPVPLQTADAVLRSVNQNIGAAHKNFFGVGETDYLRSLRVKGYREVGNALGNYIPGYNLGWEVAGVYNDAVNRGELNHALRKVIGMPEGADSMDRYFAAKRAETRRAREAEE